MDNLKEEEVCTCECHNDGVSIMHFMACCSLCYEKYISGNKIDVDRWSEAFVAIHKFKPTYLEKDNKLYWVHK